MVASIILIAAMDERRGIGKSGQLPWHLPEDLRRFRALTFGKPVLMGRATWDSLGRALPGRRNLVLSRQPDFEIPGAEVVRSLDEALNLVGEEPELWVIGGETLYREALPRAQRIFLTQVHTVVDADRYFPELEPLKWSQVQCESHCADADHKHPYSFLLLERVTDQNPR